MECPICLEDLITKECIIVDCNHIFHKKCIYYANKDKSINKCSLCRAEITIPEITKISKKITIDDKKTQQIMTDLINLMDGEEDYQFEKILYSGIIQKSWVVMGSFALFLYMRYIKEKSYDHNYSDIDVYTFQDYVTFNKKLICVKKEEKTSNSDKKKTNIINYIKRIELVNQIEFTKVKSLDIENEEFKEQKNALMDAKTKTIIDFIKIAKTNDIKKTFRDIFKTFNISCCKIAARIIREDENTYKIKFYIDKSFYYDTYHYLDEKRIMKYKYRGFDLEYEE